MHLLSLPKSFRTITNIFNVHLNWNDVQSKHAVDHEDKFYGTMTKYKHEICQLNNKTQSK